MKHAWIALSLVLLGANISHSQSSNVTRRDSIAKASSDSTEARLKRLEAELALLRQQLGDEDRHGTRTRSRVGLTLSARLQLNMFANSNRVNTLDVPQSVLAPPATANPLGSAGTKSFGMSLRQSRVGAAITVDSVMGAKFDGDIDIDFFGGVSAGPGDRKLFPELRLRTARAQLRWKKTELLFGSETPLISDLNPISLAAVGFPEFVGAGNLWNWLPQIRVTREVFASTDESNVRVAIQAAILSPFSSSLHVAETDAVDAGERSARPFLESRLRLRWGSAEDVGTAEGEVEKHGGEIGFGAHYGWVRVVGDSLQHSQAIAADVRTALGHSLELRGEVYRGQLLRGLGGGGIAQNFGRARSTETLGPPLRDVAGWIQLNYEPSPILIVGVGCGFDSVNSNDRPLRSHNGTCASHAELRPAQPVFLSFEVRRIQTRYTDQSFGATHFNLALGFEW